MSSRNQEGTQAQGKQYRQEGKKRPTTLAKWRASCTRPRRVKDEYKDIKVTTAITITKANGAKNTISRGHGEGRLEEGAGIDIPNNNEAGSSRGIPKRSAGKKFSPAAPATAEAGINFAFGYAWLRRKGVAWKWEWQRRRSRSRSRIGRRRKEKLWPNICRLPSAGNGWSSLKF